MFALQEAWHPEKIKPPNRIGQEFSRDEGPCLPKWYEARPADFSCRRRWIATDVLQFRFGNSWMFAGLAINQQPKREPNKTERADGNECRSPTPVHHDPGNEKRRENGARVCSGVENASGQRSFFLWKPFRYSFDTSWKNGGFAKSQSEPGDREAA